ncbi:MAG: monooxygenase, FAD-binding protein [Actinobacteria bacterium]|nr:monooxygenase, FAD-binding protein [Actinomycetota bacterium]
MSEPAEYDVAIVGASLAGCTAATLFGRAGRSVALIESHPDIKAYKKLCTTLIQPCATPTIHRLGLDIRIEAAGGLRTHSALHTRWGWAVPPVDDDVFGYDIRREKLDPMMRVLAAETPGVDLLMGQRARKVLTTDGRITGVATEGEEGSTREIRARLVVGADGRSSPVAKMAGVGARTVKKHGRFGYMAFFRNLELPYPKRALLWLLEPDVAFTLPHDDGFQLAALMATKDKLPAFKANLEDSFYTFFEAVPDFPKLDPANQASPIIGLMDHPNLWRSKPPPGMAFIGDAAVSADPLWGVGCGWAMQGGEWLVESTKAAFGSDAELDDAVGNYRKVLRSRLGGHFFLISDYSTGRGFNPIEKLMFSAATRDTEFARHTFKFGARTIPVHEFLAPSKVAKAIRINLRHRKEPSLVPAGK